jgi:hypothetical protein
MYAQLYRVNKSTTLKLAHREREEVYCKCANTIFQATYLRKPRSHLNFQPVERKNGEKHVQLSTRARKIVWYASSTGILEFPFEPRTLYSTVFSDSHILVWYWKRNTRCKGARDEDKKPYIEQERTRQKNPRKRTHHQQAIWYHRKEDARGKQKGGRLSCWWLLI